ncbi:5-oxoprolinase subunit B family protein [Paracoccus aerodenitrificans]|uniref:5-oxoprolinase subunit B family protein n=1 Tax=Paracoccus aerodenitrificans TaxID=3017781 RepID=UPI0022F01E4E|nr:carboxyltransferase domain-containing protein [Paracoccus aerodenitrificans]WBU63989.1 carboxyltransferase domain-containing protein [Paracoccus aerodenitrificans]
MSMADDYPRVAFSGLDGLVVSFAPHFDDTANRAALALRARIEAENWSELRETASSLVSTLIRFDPLSGSSERLRDRVLTLLEGWDWRNAELPEGRRRLVIPASFDPDIAPQSDEAAAAAGLSGRDALIEAVCGADLRVLTIGFAPGQPYIGQLPEFLDLPRQRKLTPRVPVGALGLAIRQLVLFAVDTQTGWRHVGQTAMRLFQPGKEDPFLLRPGDVLRFHPVSAADLSPLWDDPRGGARIEDIA